MTAFCQTGKVTGSVMDAETKTPLELATVNVFRPDSSLLTYKLTDKNGKFTIDKLPLKDKLSINVTYTGYLVYRAALQIDGQRIDTLAVLLALNNKDTNAVVVTAAIPIRMNGDTLEINPAAFKMKNDAVVEELLNQVAGITIWSDGTITMDGKKFKVCSLTANHFLDHLIHVLLHKIFLNLPSKKFNFTRNMIEVRSGRKTSHRILC
jgi:predicted ribonuclease YlaK